MILINGKPQTQIAVADRGFQYGDGLFETIEILNNQLVFFDQHLQRLERGCQRLLLPALNKPLIIQEAKQLTDHCSRGILKIIITRGMGGRGYRQPQIISSTRILSRHPFPEYSDSLQKPGVKLRFCQQRLALNPTLAGLKHLNRLEQILARAEWSDDSIQEGLMLDINDQVIEGTMSNVFFVIQGKLYTPSLEQSGIAGIMRDFVIRSAKKLGIKTKQGFFPKKDLLMADEIFVTNSVIGIWAVQFLEQQSFAKGLITQQLQRELILYKQQFL